MIGTALKVGFEAFGAAGLVTKLAVVATAGVTLLGAYGVWHHHVWSKGYDHALADIAKQDQKAIARARDYRDRVRDCAADGRLWDQSTGQCKGR